MDDFFIFRDLRETVGKLELLEVFQSLLGLSQNRMASLCFLEDNQFCFRLDLVLLLLELFDLLDLVLHLLQLLFQQDVL